MEHGYQGNFLKTYAVAEKNELKFIFGAEAYFLGDRRAQSRDVGHICVFAKTREGHRQVTAMLSEASKTGYYFVPRIDHGLLFSLNPKDVFITSACVSFWGNIDKETGALQWTEGRDAFIDRLASHFGENFCLEVQAHNTPWQKEVNQRVLGYYKQKGIPLIAGMDSHYIFPEQEQEREWLREQSNIKLASRAFETDPNYKVYEDFPDEETLVGRFKTQAVLSAPQIREAIKQTDVFLNFEELKFTKERKLPTIRPGLTQEERNQEYERLVDDGWKAYRESVPLERWDEYEAAIAEEKAVVTGTNTSDYFIIDHALVDEAKRNGGAITTTGRGSAGGFFCNTLLGLSTLDRFDLPVALYPERFVSKERLMTSVPDIDMNLAETEPFEIAQIKIMGGETHARRMISYGTMKTRAAFKFYARVKNLSFEISNIISAQLGDYEEELKYADEEDDVDILDFVDEKYMPYVNESAVYRDIVCSKSPAPCGWLIYNGNIDEEIGVVRVKSKTGKKDVLCTVVDGYTLDDFGYVKNDLLKVDVVAIIKAVCDEIGMKVPTSKEIIARTKGDRDTWSIFANGYTMCVNQCERNATVSKLKQYKPRNLSELSAFVAAIRPGFRSMLPQFLARKPFSYGIPALDKLIQTGEMKDSYMLYQEHSMKALNFAKISMENTYPIIKAISKKKIDKIKKWKDTFLDGFAGNIVEMEHTAPEEAKEAAEKSWKVIEDSSSYSFNACLSGRQLLYKPGIDDINNPSIEEMYNITHDPEYAMEMGCSELRTRWLQNGYSYGLSVCDDGRLRKNKIVDIRLAGHRPVYHVETESGESIDCTLNHRFPTPDSVKRLEELDIGDLLYKMLPSATEQDQNSFLVGETKIASIRYVGNEDVYDVEMAAPHHTFVTNTGLVTHNSHAVAVSLDALYCAYLKAKYPMQFYKTVLQFYAEKGKKDKVASIKSEMYTAFGIRIVSCRFGEDNRTFRYDEEQRTMTDTIQSIKGLSMTAARSLYAAAKHKFVSFLDFLDYNLDHKVANSGQIGALVKLGYFSCFGGAKKLLREMELFKTGKNRLTAALKPESRASRKLLLAEEFCAIPDKDFTPVERASFEVELLGSPIQISRTEPAALVVLDVDTQYSPKIYGYNLSRGTSGMMKMKKDQFAAQPTKKGDVLRIRGWKPRPVYRYAKDPDTGKSTKSIVPGQCDNWITAFDVLYSAGA